MLESQISNYHRLLSVTAWCLRFYHRLKTPHASDPDSRGRFLSVRELKQAEQRLALLSQARSFSKEKQALLHDQPVHNQSKLISLAPFIDGGQLIRVGGRL